MGGMLSILAAGERPAVARPAMGRFTHEAVALDPASVDVARE